MLTGVVFAAFVVAVALVVVLVAGAFKGVFLLFGLCRIALQKAGLLLVTPLIRGERLAVVAVVLVIWAVISLQAGQHYAQLFEESGQSGFHVLMRL